MEHPQHLLLIILKKQKLLQQILIKIFLNIDLKELNS